MEKRIRDLYLAMSEFDRGRPDLIQHFTKVHAYAALIAECEGLDVHTCEILQAAALVHDIAIPLCDQKYGSHPGPLQEQEGPVLVRSLLSDMDFTETEINRICTLVGGDSLEHTLRHVIATATGKRLFAAMFGLEE